MAAHCRSVWRAGNFREGEFQHVVRGLVRVDGLRCVETDSVI
jgi:hypothetical protein